jgi:hypothetical protein
MRPEGPTTTHLRRWWLIALVVVIAFAIWFLAVGAPPRPQETPTGAQAPDAPRRR